MDVEHADPQRGLVGEVPELPDHGVAGAGVFGDAELARVVVGEADAELPASSHGLDPREEQVVVAEAEVGGEVGIQAGHALVEALREQVQLLRIGRTARLVDLDPSGSQADQGLVVRPDHVPSDVQDETPAGVVALGPAGGVGVAEVMVLEVALVEGPVRDGVGARDRDLQVTGRRRPQEGELVVVVGLAQGDGPDHGGLRVVLVVEGPDAAPPLEAVRVSHGPRVHLAPLLFTVVDGVQSGSLLHPQSVPAGPLLDLVLLLLAGER